MAIIKAKLALAEAENARLDKIMALRESGERPKLVLQ